MFELWIKSVPLLQKKIWDNSGLEYLLAFITFIGLWLVLGVVYRILIGRLSKGLSIKAPRYVRLFDGLRGTIHPSLLMLVAAHIALQRLEPTGKFARYWDVFYTGALTLQMTLIVIQLASDQIMNVSFGRNDNDLSVRSLRINLRSLTRIGVWVCAILFFLSNVGVDITTFVTGLGIGGIAIALAAQNILGDVFSSFTIALDKPFEIGDYIQADTFVGWVEHIGLRTTRLRGPSGETLVLPNSDLTKARIRNFKRLPERAIIFKIGVTYATPMETIKKIPDLLKSIVCEQPGMRFERANFVTFAESSLGFEVSCFAASDKYASQADALQPINMRIGEEFSKRGIQFAFPTRTIHVESMPATT